MQKIGYQRFCLVSISCSRFWIYYLFIKIDSGRRCRQTFKVLAIISRNGGRSKSSYKSKFCGSCHSTWGAFFGTVTDAGDMDVSVSMIC